MTELWMIDPVEESEGEVEEVEEKLYVSAREIVGMQKKVDNVPWQMMTLPIATICVSIPGPIHF